LSRGREPGNVRVDVPVYPILVECDMQGRILWMSDAARSRVGNAENLADTIVAQWAVADRATEVWSQRISRVLRIKDSMIVSLHAVQTAAVAPGDPAPALLDLQTGLLSHYFRLQKAEQTLSRRAQGLRGDIGRGAVRQLELERQRLGRELHTGIGQMLAAIRMQLEIVVQQIPQMPLPAQQALHRIATLASDALDQVRGISRRLHPPEWQRLKLEEALVQLWEVSGIPQSHEAVLRIQAPIREPDLEIKVLLYRTAQEAFSNLRHARATRVEMTLEALAEELRLEIRDNGAGFDAEALFAAPASVASGIGLRSIREQAEELGGKMMVESGPSGTTLKVLAPYSPVGT